MAAVPVVCMPLTDQYFCSRCDQTIHSGSKDEHEDWHFAMDLQAEDQDRALASERPAPAAPQAQRLDLTQAGDSKSDQPSEYAPPSYPPPRNGASRATAIHRHTNQVIEAAKVRARDEVRFAFTLDVTITTSTNFLAATNAECATESSITV